MVFYDKVEQHGCFFFYRSVEFFTTEGCLLYTSGEEVDEESTVDVTAGIFLPGLTLVHLAPSDSRPDSG